VFIRGRKVDKSVYYIADDLLSVTRNVTWYLGALIYTYIGLHAKVKNKNSQIKTIPSILT